jgi:hypothetical protein
MEDNMPAAITRATGVRLVGAALALAAVAAAAGCGSSKAATAAAPSGLRDVSVPSCAKDIANAAGHVVGPDGDPTVVVVMGSGSRGLVLAPMSNGNDCQWIGQARHFVDEGYLVASLSSGKDRAASVRYVAQLLYYEGAKKVALLGGSIGGTAVVAAAPEVSPAPVGVVALSPAVASASALNPLVAAAKYDGPMLTVGDKGDSIVSIDEVTSLAAAHHNGSGKNDADATLELTGSTHGLDMFGEDASLIGRVDDFLKAAFS